MKTIFSRILCAALFVLVGVVDSHADEAPPAVADAETVAAIRAAADAWAAAWSSREVEAYLGHYAADFEPPENMSRDAWEQQRRQRLQRPAHISVELDWIGIAVQADGSADASFTQSYKSPTYSDQVVKTLSMVLVDGQWRIRGERAGELAVPQAVTAAAEPAMLEAPRQDQMEQEAKAAQEAAMREAAEREAAEKEAALREAAEQEAALREAAEREAAAQEAALREAAEREAAAAPEAAAMMEAAEQEAAAAQEAAMREAAEQEAAMRAAAEEAARQAAEAYAAEQQAATKVESVLKEVQQQEGQPASAVKEAVVPRAAGVESGSGTWKIAGILMFLLLAPAVAYGTLVRPQQMAAA